MASSTSPEIKLRTGESVDVFMEGRLKLIQSKDGYRFSIDAILLADFVTIKPGDLVVDLGTGCGVIPLVLLLTKDPAYAVGLEIQKGLASQAARNVRLNGFHGKMDVILGDMRNPPFAERRADVVICNPPYRRIKSGRINPDERRAVARHEILASIDDILKAVIRVIKKKGRLAMIYPAARLADIMVRLKSCNLEPKKIQIIYPDLQASAKLALIEATAGGRTGMEIRPPLLGQGSFAIKTRA